MRPRLVYLPVLLIGFVCTSACGLSFGQVAQAGRSGASVLSQLAKLTASDGIGSDFFGCSVAVSGNTVVAGNDPNYPTDRSWVYVFVKPETGWGDMTQTAKLTASDGVRIGGSVAISGNTVVAVSLGGAAYVFVRPASGWSDMTETAKLRGSDGDGFWQVAISGNTIVATSLTTEGALGGLAYVFVRPAGGWADMTETARLTPSDGVQQFGVSVAFGGDTVVVGDGTVGSLTSPGAAYVFVKPASGWVNMTETAKLTASDALPGDGFGYSSGISADGTTVAIGVPYTTTSGFLYYGTAYVFVKPAGGWASMTENAKLGAAGGPKFMGFGWSVAVDAHGHALVVGAPAIAQYPTIRGHAYVFNRPPSGWKTTSKPNARFTAADGGANDGFGISVAANSGTLVIGASYINNAQGAAYAFGSQ